MKLRRILPSFVTAVKKLIFCSITFSKSVHGYLTMRCVKQDSLKRNLSILIPLSTHLFNHSLNTTKFTLDFENSCCFLTSVDQVTQMTWLFLKNVQHQRPAWTRISDSCEPVPLIEKIQEVYIQFPSAQLPARVFLLSFSPELWTEFSCPTKKQSCRTPPLGCNDFNNLVELTR